jgi:hypothetical protein
MVPVISVFFPSQNFLIKPGCGCTALGKYKIGDKYKGRFGTAYKLLGLDSSNNNAFKKKYCFYTVTIWFQIKRPIRCRYATQSWLCNGFV